MPVVPSAPEAWCRGRSDPPIGILLQAFQRPCASCCRAHEPLQLIAAVGWNMRVGVQGKAMHTGTPGAGQERAFAFVPKA